MPLVTNKEILDAANSGSYAVGAFNINDMEFLQGIVRAADELKSPAIIQVSEGAIKFAGIDYLISMVKLAASKTQAQISLHLDHGEHFDIIIDCIKKGFTSVMFDGSHFPFEENIANTRKVADIAHMFGVSVEGELGRLQGIEDNINVSEKDAILTDPNVAADFVERTGVDALAVAIGTSHGAYKFKGSANLDFDRLKKIKELVKTPIVLHGASGVSGEIVEKANSFGAQIKGASGIPNDNIKRAVSMGVNKINIDTDLRLAYTAAIRESFSAKPENFDPRKYLGPARDAVYGVVKTKIELFGSAGKSVR